MTKLRYSMDGKRTLPTEAETFTDDDGSKLLIEVWKGFRRRLLYKAW